MTDRTILFAVDNSQDYAVTAQTYCTRITVQENYNSVTPPTADLLQKIPPGAAAAINIPKGTPAIYTAQSDQKHFNPGDIVGTIRTVAGAITVQQIESSRI